MAKRPSKTTSQTLADQGEAMEPASTTEQPPVDDGSADHHVSEAGPAAGAAPAEQDAAAGLAASDPLASGKSVAEGTISTDNPESDEQGGAGNAAGPAQAAVREILDAGPFLLDEAPGQSPLAFEDGKLAIDVASIVDVDAIGKSLLRDPDFVLPEREEFRQQFPLVTAAFEAYAASHETSPSGLRITSKIDGFRRAGMAHPKTAVEHPLNPFADPLQIEQLLGEPNLVVELI